MPSQHDFSYCAALLESQRVNWQIEDIIGDDKTLDFTRPFLPESLARTAGLGFLTSRERITLNQIRAQGYLHFMGFLEELILSFVMGHVRPNFDLRGDRTLALLQFASEEAKHISLFRQFRQRLVAGCGFNCQVIGPAEEVGRTILAQPPLGVSLMVLQVGCMAQRHYLDSVKDGHEIDPQFRSLLHHHWMEEVQHAKLDALMIAETTDSLEPSEVERGIEGYLEIVGELDETLKAQVRLDLESLSRVKETPFTERETEAFLTQQHQASRWTFLGCGMSDSSFLDTVEQVSEGAGAGLEDIALLFS